MLTKTSLAGRYDWNYLYSELCIARTSVHNPYFSKAKLYYEGLQTDGRGFMNSMTSQQLAHDSFSGFESGWIKIDDENQRSGENSVTGSTPKGEYGAVSMPSNS